MTTSTAVPTAQPRKSRTRTTNVSCKDPLRLTQLPPSLVDLTPRAEHLACPECETWCPLTTHKGTKDCWKLVPHHTLPAGTPGARRCGNSNRRFVIDMPIAVWQKRRAEAVADVAARRPTKVLRKVPTPKPLALHQLTPAPPTADTAYLAYVAHRSRCAACTDPALKLACPDGRRLGATFVHLLGQEPERRAAQARAEQEQRIAERKEAEQAQKRRAAEWAERLPATHHADMLRRTARLNSHAEPRHLVYGAQAPTTTLHPSVPGAGDRL
jgi:hypothetical protein